MADDGRSSGSSISVADDKVNFACLPCMKHGRNNAADKYCVQCQEYLCVSCVTSHNSFSIMIGHILQGYAGRATTESLPTVPTKTCGIHKAKVIEFYCKTHDVVGCSICTNMKHRLCEIHYIPDFVKNNPSDPNFTTIKASTLKTEQNLNVLRGRLQQNQDELREAKEKSIKDIQNFKDELKNIIDRLEKASLYQLSQKFDETDAKLQEDINDVEKRLAELMQTKGEIDSTQLNSLQKFVSAKVFLHDNKETETRLSEHLKSPKYNLSFTRFIDIFKFLTRYQGIGKVEISNGSLLGGLAGLMKGKL